MGSKMAAAARVVQVVKPHTPLIKFPDRKGNARPKIKKAFETKVEELLRSSEQILLEAMLKHTEDMELIQDSQHGFTTSESCLANLVASMMEQPHQWTQEKESLQANVPSLHASNAQESVGARSPAFQNTSPGSRVQGIPDTSELARILPLKYRRRLVSEEEIEYIQRGGPE